MLSALSLSHSLASLLNVSSVPLMCCVLLQDEDVIKRGSSHPRKLVILRFEWQSVLVFIVPIILRFFVKKEDRQDPEEEGTTEAAADLGSAHLAIPPPVDTSAQEDTAASGAAEKESVHSEISLPIHKTGTGMFS